MEKAAVIHKIQQIPEPLMGLVSDFLDKLVQSYELGLLSEKYLSEEEKQELLNAIAEYEADPSTGVKWETLKPELTGMYGL